jgi:hypothetical protein
VPPVARAFVVKTTSVPPQPSSSLVRYLTARQPSMPNVASLLLALVTALAYRLTRPFMVAIPDAPVASPRSPSPNSCGRCEAALPQNQKPALTSSPRTSILCATPSHSMLDMPHTVLTQTSALTDRQFEISRLAGSHPVIPGAFCQLTDRHCVRTV